MIARVRIKQRLSAQDVITDLLLVGSPILRIEAPTRSSKAAHLGLWNNLLSFRQGQTTRGCRRPCTNSWIDLRTRPRPQRRCSRQALSVPAPSLFRQAHTEGLKTPLQLDHTHRGLVSLWKTKADYRLTYESMRGGLLFPANLSSRPTESFLDGFQRATPWQRTPMRVVPAEHPPLVFSMTWEAARGSQAVASAPAQKTALHAPWPRQK